MNCVSSDVCERDLQLAVATLGKGEALHVAVLYAGAQNGDPSFWVFVLAAIRIRRRRRIPCRVGGS